MKILAVSDKESPYYWDYFDKSKLEGIDLIISCGDLEPEYLSFLATFTSSPVIYVHGNHDDKYERFPPEGCVCIDDDVFVYKGVRVLGLGGSMRYKPGDNQYTEKEMRKRARSLKLRRKIQKNGGFDILVTHAPAHGIHEGKDLPHMGFATFNELMDKYSPKYFLYGHVHMSYNWQYTRFDSYRDTKVINAYERVVFDYDENEPASPSRAPSSERIDDTDIGAKDGGTSAAP